MVRGLALLASAAFAARAWSATCEAGTYALSSLEEAANVDIDLECVYWAGGAYRVGAGVVRWWGRARSGLAPRGAYVGTRTSWGGVTRVVGSWELPRADVYLVGPARGEPIGPLARGEYGGDVFGFIVGGVEAPSDALDTQGLLTGAHGATPGRVAARVVGKNEARGTLVLLAKHWTGDPLSTATYLVGEVVDAATYALLPTPLNYTGVEFEYATSEKTSKGVWPAGAAESFLVGVMGTLLGSTV